MCACTLVGWVSFFPLARFVQAQVFAKHHKVRSIEIRRTKTCDTSNSKVNSFCIVAASNSIYANKYNEYLAKCVFFALRIHLNWVVCFIIFGSRSFSNSNFGCREEKYAYFWLESEWMIDKKGETESDRMPRARLGGCLSCISLNDAESSIARCFGPEFIETAYTDISI